MPDSTAQSSVPLASTRKDDHVRLAAAQQSEHRTTTSSPWDDVRFVHDALAGVDAARVDIGTSVVGSSWPLPFYINAMTGGSEHTGRINRALAIAARETGVALATGSMSVGLDSPETLPTFRVMRDENPSGFVFANVGIERSPDDALRAIEAIGADALQVHINAAQETVMPEGSRDFSSWPASLEAIVGAVDVPVVAKEVGFGLTARALRRLAELGVAAADVSGNGGTDFVRIENDRRAARDFAYLAGWGQSAVECLLDASATGSPEASTLPLLASGAVRTPLDVVRALALGARGVGVSGAFLSTVLDAGALADGGPDPDAGAAALIALIETWREHVTSLFALLGAADLDALSRTDLIIRGEAASFAAARDIDIAAWAHRATGGPSWEKDA